MGPQQLPFLKGHGTGNDFVLLPDLDGRGALDAELAVALCDRRTGIGADGVLRVAPADDGGWFMDHRNADGSTAEMCGNGIRVFARYLVSVGMIAPGRHRILTRGGHRTVDVPAEGDVSVDMGPPLLDGIERTVSLTGQRPRRGISVDMGNPHVVVSLDGPGQLDGPGDAEGPAEAEGPARLAAVDLCTAPVASPVFPHGVNVEVIAATGPRSLSMRVHERGVGETQSCGTGACAAAVAAAALGGVTGDWEWQVRVPGGDLVVRSGDGTLTLTGPAVLLAEGTVDLLALGVRQPSGVPG